MKKIIINRHLNDKVSENLENTEEQEQEEHKTANKNDNIGLEFEKEMDRLIDSYVKVNASVNKDTSKCNLTVFDLNYPLSRLLNKHSIFKKSEQNLLPKLNILNQSDQKLISFSLINNKIYQSYIDALKKMDPIIQSSLKFRETKKQYKSEQQNINVNEMVGEMFKALKYCESSCEFFLKEIPGLSTLPLECLGKMIKLNIINFFLISYVNYYEDGELIFYLENGYHVTRKALEKIRGKFICNLQFNALDSLNNLKITEREKAVLLAYLFSMSNENINNCEKQKNLYDFYKAALVYELELTKRDREYLINFDHMIDNLTLIQKYQFADENNNQMI